MSRCSGAEIATNAALFDEALYQGGIASDLFEEKRYFTDPDEFWRLQNAAIAATRDALLAAGWSEVHILAPDQRFQVWEFEKAAKSRGGAVYIDVEPDGVVTIHKGLVPISHHRSHENCRTGATTTAGKTASDRPELSAPLANVIDLVRHSAVRLAVAQTPGLALRLALAQLIGGSPLWAVETERQTPLNDTIAQRRDTLPTQAAYGDLRRAALDRLGLDQDGFTTHDRRDAGAPSILARLIAMPDDEVMGLLALVVAETLAMGTSLIDAAGLELKVDIGAHWQPDDLFFDLAKDREAVGAMLEEVIGKCATRAYLTEPASKKKAIIRRALAGDGRAKVEGWMPRYMAFPQAGYTARPLTAHRA